MSEYAIIVENMSKQYRLGEVGTGTLSHDLNRWWHLVRGKDDPYSKVGALNDHSQSQDEDYVWVLQDIDFKVKPGEVLGIIGKNGAGKSTLLKILTKVTGPTTGKIEMNGRVASLLEVGTGFHPELTGRENIYLNGTILGMSRKEVAVKLDEIVDFAGVAKYLDTPVKRYSSGMKVRLGFAVAAHLEPEILIVDEVLAVGDVEFQRKAVGKMKEVSSQTGRTVLFVSHNMASVKNLCTRAILLDKGYIAKTGDPHDIIQAYISRNTVDENLSLQDRTDRGGTGDLRFIRWNTFSSEETDMPQVGISGNRFVVRLYVDLKKAIDNITFSIGIFSLEGTLYTACRSDSIKKRFDLKMGKHEVDFVFNRLPLTAGRYSFNLIAYDGKTVLDWVKDAGFLDVENGDYYGTGILPAKGRQSVLTEYDWQI